MAGARTTTRSRHVVDARLSRLSRAARPFLVLTVVLGTVTAALVVAQAWLLADLIAGGFAGRGLAAAEAALVVLLAVVVARAGVIWGSEVAANRCSARVKSDLRRALTTRVAALGPNGVPAGRTGHI